MSQNCLEPDIDLEAIRAKYRQERDKRLRPDGELQYLSTSGKFARYGEDDPYAAEPIVREPLQDETEVIIIGGGWGGLLSAVRLREQGFTDIRIVESGSDFGGTWYWNRYPGAQCDVEAYCYMPLLEETGYLPTEKYAHAPELFEHAQRIGRSFDLYDNACFQTRVTEIRWNDTASRWHVITSRGDDMRAKFVVMASGPANRPKLPGIPGIEDFQGKTFHTSRWDYNYTGGDNRGNLTKLHDKTVAIIGTGATAIQCVPYLAKDVKQLYVFQRTPSSVDLRGNKPTDPAWASDLKPGWQRERQLNFDDVVTGAPFEVDMVADAWTDMARVLRMMLQQPGEATIAPQETARLAELADAQKMNQLRARVDAEVKDPETAEALKAWYRQWCKRPTFNDEYLKSFDRPNVTLVDTSGCHGVQKITADGLIANGAEYKVDCIIFATGFETSSSFRRRIGFEIFGRGGESLYDHWANGMRTFHGYGIHGFPNYFFVGASQNALSPNFSGTANEQAVHVAHVMKEASVRNAVRIEVTAEAEQEWVSEIQRLAVDRSAFKESCTPGYYNNEGQTENTVGSPSASSYTPGPRAFANLLEKWRNEAEFQGIDFS